MTRLTTFLAGTACAVLLAVSANAEEKLDANTVLASVDGVNVTLGHVVALRGRLPEQYQQLPDQVLMDAIVEQLIQQTVLMNAIKGKLDNRTALGLENEKRAYLASEMMIRISETEVSEDVLKSTYAERYDGAIPEQEYNASHILIETREEAEEIIKLLEDGAEFATVAKERSTGPSGPNGGALGWFGKNQMVKEFEDAVLALAVGEISPPVETQFGWHVVKLNEMRDTVVPTLDDVRADLTLELQEKAVEEEITALTAAAKIERTELVIDPAIIRDVSIFND
ncbi:MAG: peptidylprolyl isomerase [Rhodobacteraceae bacterium]|nr:peptidylprolyl isomerase [Paracoccaceae bacterium]